MRFLFIILLLLVFLTPAHPDEVVEHDGDHYTIYVDRMDLKGDESLMDIILMCPEFFTCDGRTIISDYCICIDGLDLQIDNESFLRNTKASDVSIVQINNHSAVSNGYEANEGEFNIIFRKNSASDQVNLSGSTYGNAQLYADYTLHSADDRFSLAATAIGNLRYRKSNEDGPTTKRAAEQDVRLAARWHLSDRDSLQLVFAQSFHDTKTRYLGTPFTYPVIEREFSFIAAYQHLLNSPDDDDDLEDGDDDDEAEESIIATEWGAEYLSADLSPNDMRNAIVYGLVESEFPLFDDHLLVLAGTEHGYENVWQVGLDRQHYLYDDVYLQVNGLWGPFQITLGDRFRLVNYWHKPYATTQEQWHKRDHQNDIVAIVSCELGGGHTVQASLTQRHDTPAHEDLLEFNTKRRAFIYYADYLMPTVYNTQLRYTYQCPSLVLMTSADSYQFHSAPSLPSSEYAVRASAQWHSGPLWLTLGASFHHRQWQEKTDNFYNLKFMPSVYLSSRTRLSGTLLYISNRYNHDESPNLYANIRMSHRISSRINLFADYHDIAGQKTGNRALTLGATFYLP